MNRIILLVACLFLQACGNSAINSVKDLEVAKSGKTISDVVDSSSYIKESKFELVSEDENKSTVKFSAKYNVDKCVDDMVYLINSGYSPNKQDINGKLPSYNYILYTGVAAIFQGFDDYSVIEKLLREDQRMHNLEVVVEFVVLKGGLARPSSEYYIVDGNRKNPSISGYIPELLNGNIPAEIVSVGGMIKKDYAKKLYDEEKKRRHDEHVAQANEKFGEYKKKLYGDWYEIKNVVKDSSSERVFIYEFEVFKFSESEGNSLILNSFMYKVRTDRFLQSILECDKRDAEQSLRNKIDGNNYKYTPELLEKRMSEANEEIAKLDARINDIGTTPYRVIESKPVIKNLILNFNAIYKERDVSGYAYATDFMSELNGMNCYVYIADGLNKGEEISFQSSTNPRDMIYLKKPKVTSGHDDKIYNCQGYTGESDVLDVFFQDMIINFDYVNNVLKN